MEFGQKKFFPEIDLFDFTSFFGLDVFKFSGPLCIFSSFQCPSQGTPEYKIVCPGGPGYQPNPNTGILEDINECNTMINICTNGRCSNTFGSYMCTCNNGFELDDSAIGCVDIGRNTAGQAQKIFNCPGQKKTREIKFPK